MLRPHDILAVIEQLLKPPSESLSSMDVCFRWSAQIKSRTCWGVSLSANTGFAAGHNVGASGVFVGAATAISLDGCGPVA